MKRLLYLLVFFAAFAAQTAYGQAASSSLGKEFYCMVMKNLGSADPLNQNRYNRLYLSCAVPATATITIEDPPFFQTVTIQPHVVTTVDLPYDVEDSTEEVATRQAIHVVADTDISVYLIYHKRFSTDSYMALPVTSLGTEHIAVCYPSSLAGYFSDTAPEIGIIAVEDGTSVTVTPRASTSVGDLPNVPFTVSLKKGDTYFIYGDRHDPLCDLTGTPITSNKPIAVISGHERAAVPDSGASRNCLVEQVPPTSTLGTSFITVPFIPRTPPKGDYIRIVAPLDGTVVQLDGTIITTLAAGTFYEWRAYQPTRIQTTNPVLVAQYSLSATDSAGDFNDGNPPDYNEWDPSMMIIPPTQQFLSDYTFANAVDSVGFTHNYVNVVVPDGAVASLRLDGAPIVTPFTSVPGTGYSYAQIPTTQESHNITASQPFGIYVYGLGPADAYANTGGAAFRVLTGLLVTTNDLDFGSVPTDTCRDSVVVFRNAGKAPITVWKIWLTDSAAGDFTVTSGAPPFTIAPGDSHLVGVKFCPSALGVRGMATVRFSSNAVERPLITVHGIGTKIGVAADVDVLDYRQVLIGSYKDSVFVLRNIGTKTADFDSLTITGPNASDFVLRSPQGKFTLVPNATQTVTVRFFPTVEGIETATIHTVGASGMYASVGLLGEGIDARLVGLPDTVDYGNVKVMRTKDSLLTAQSAGKFTASVSGFMMIGNDPTEFALGPNRVKQVPTGDTMQVNVRFAPTSAGVKTAVVAWREAESPTTPGVIFVRGNGAYAAVALSPRVIDFGRVKVNRRRDSTVVTRNIGVVDASILGYAIVGADAPNFSYVPQLVPPFGLAPGAISPMTVSFTPIDTGFKHAQLVVMNDGAAPDTIADLYGNARPGLYIVATGTDTIRAKVGDTIRVPVRLLGSLDDADINAYRVQLSFDSTMLYPLGVHVDSTWNAAQFSPVMAYTPGFTDVQAVAPAPLQGTGILYSIDMLVLLGDAMETPLTLNNARYTDVTGDSTAVNTALRHGLFQLVNFCGDSGGLITVGTPLSLSTISPNPLSGDAVVQFTVPAIGPVHCALVDLLGRDAAVLADGEHNPGQYTALLHGSALPQGSYVLVLQAGRFRELKRVQIVR